MKKILILILLSILSLPLWLTIRPAIEMTFEELSMSSTNPESHPISISNSRDLDSTITTTNISIGDPAYDQFDSSIINASNHYGITDKLLVKSLIMQESHFDIFTISSDSPCGEPDGWTEQESKSFGLTQVTPVCGEVAGGRPKLANFFVQPRI